MMEVKLTVSNKLLIYDVKANALTYCYPMPNLSMQQMVKRVLGNFITNYCNYSKKTIPVNVVVSVQCELTVNLFNQEHTKTVDIPIYETILYIPPKETNCISHDLRHYYICGEVTAFEEYERHYETWVDECKHCGRKLKYTVNVDESEDTKFLSQECESWIEVLEEGKPYVESDN